MGAAAKSFAWLGLPALFQLAAGWSRRAVVIGATRNEVTIGQFEGGDFSGITFGLKGTLAFEERGPVHAR